MKTIFKIGEKAYPTDNSYLTSIDDLEEPLLAGTIKDSPKLVEVISEPYNKQFINILGDKKILEFIQVSYNDKTYEILNRLVPTIAQYWRKYKTI